MAPEHRGRRRRERVRPIVVPREPAWRAGASGWSRQHLGAVLQTVAFTIAAIVLLVLRSNDLTAQLSVVALALGGVAGGGPLMGVEQSVPLGVGHLLTVLGWLGGPLGLPTVALAILYFPSPSPLLRRYPWIQAIPFVAAAPMILPSAATGLYLAGVDALRDAAVWDASHPGVCYASFAAALATNVAVIVEGLYRYRFLHDANQRRRIRMAVYTGVPSVLAYFVKDGVPVVAGLLGARELHYPLPVTAVLQALVLLPAFGLPYAVGVARVLGPRLVLRRSIQYALATRTLSVLGIAPLVALVVSLARNSNKTLAQIVTSGSGVYIVLVIATLLAFRYKDKARQWLDERFFREEYDARKILQSLVSRVRFETDPADLATLVVDEIDEALHPERTALLVSGMEPGRARGDGLARRRRHAAARRGRPGDDAAMVGSAARHPAGRSALAGPPAARPMRSNGWSRRAPRCWCRFSVRIRRSSPCSCSRRSDRRRRTRPTIASCWEHRAPGQPRPRRRATAKSQRDERCRRSDPAPAGDRGPDDGVSAMRPVRGRWNGDLSGRRLADEARAARSRESSTRSTASSS